MEAAKENGWYTWYQSFDENHSSETRRQWYNKDAQAYHWARPRYPEALLDQVLNEAGLTRPATEALTEPLTEPATEPSAASPTVLEIGCGPGIATAALAARGLRVQALDPSSAACELARESCKAYGQVTVHNSTFEDYPLAGQTFDAVLAATSFHWVSPAIACKKSAAALKPGGSLILLWATPPQPSEALYQYLQAVYDRFDLSDIGHHQHRSEAYYHHNFQTFAHTVSIAESALFQLTEVHIQEHHTTYSCEKYLALLSTLSDYIALEEHIRLDLFNALEHRLSEWLAQEDQADELALSHWFAAQAIPLK